MSIMLKFPKVHHGSLWKIDFYYSSNSIFIRSMSRLKNSDSHKYVILIELVVKRRLYDIRKTIVTDIRLNSFCKEP